MVPFLAAVTAFFEAIPAILTLIRFYQDAKQKGWIEKGRDLATEIKGANSDEERMALAKRLFEHRAK
jgi:hypothetical protein